VSYMKGTLELKSEAGKGTQINIYIPLQADNLYANRQ